MQEKQSSNELYSCLLMSGSCCCCCLPNAVWLLLLVLVLAITNIPIDAIEPKGMTGLQASCAPQASAPQA